MTRPHRSIGVMSMSAVHRRRRNRARLGGLVLPLLILLFFGMEAWQRGVLDAVLAGGTFSAADPPPLRAPYRLPPPGSAEPPAARPARPSHAIAARLTGNVVRIVDGDGLVLSTGDEIRLGDFNAPEWNQPGGAEAKEALTEIADGEDLVCTPCEGARNAKRCTSYDRIIATCRLNGARLGDLMRARGIAEGGR